MSKPLTEVICQLVDCMHYHTDSAKPGIVFCKHTDKPHYMNALPCPLYRLDWQKRAAAAQDLLKMFKK